MAEEHILHQRAIERYQVKLAWMGDDIEEVFLRGGSPRLVVSLARVAYRLAHDEFLSASPAAKRAFQNAVAHREGL